MTALDLETFEFHLGRIENAHVLVLEGQAHQLDDVRLVVHDQHGRHGAG